MGYYGDIIGRNRGKNLNNEPLFLIPVIAFLCSRDSLLNSLGSHITRHGDVFNRFGLGPKW